MHDLIEQRKDLLDPEVLSISKMLDAILNEYVKMVKICEEKRLTLDKSYT